MTELITVLHYIKFVIKLLLFIILLPLAILWYMIKFYIYKFEFKRNLMKSGMPNDVTKRFSKDIKLMDLCKIKS